MLSLFLSKRQIDILYKQNNLKYKRGMKTILYIALFKFYGLSRSDLRMLGRPEASFCSSSF